MKNQNAVAAASMGLDRHYFDASLENQGSQNYARQTGRDKLERRFSDMAALLVDPATGRIRTHYIRERSCPNCGHRGPYNELFKKFHIPVVSCPGCAMVFASPCLSKEGEKKIYEDSTVWTKEHARFLSSPTYVRYSTLRYRYQLGVIECFVDGGDRTHLDIGAGTGQLMRIAQEFGWKSSGIDSNGMVVEIARAAGLDVVKGWFSRDTIDRQYQLVTLLDVLEHISDLADSLAALADSVQEGGLLFIQVPNVDSITLSLVGKDHPTNNGLVHVNYFSPKTIVSVVEPHGFMHCHTETILTEFSVLKTFSVDRINAELRRLGGSCTADQLDPDTILNNALGYKLMSVFRKNA